MKKIIVIIVAVLAILLAACTVVVKYNENTSLAIIGGADGPTSIFLAGTLGDIFLIPAILLGTGLFVVGIVVFRKHWK